MGGLKQTTCPLYRYRLSTPAHIRYCDRNWWCEIEDDVTMTATCCLFLWTDNKSSAVLRRLRRSSTHVHSWLWWCGRFTCRPGQYHPWYCIYRFIRLLWSFHYNWYVISRCYWRIYSHCALLHASVLVFYVQNFTSLNLKSTSWYE